MKHSLFPLLACCAVIALASPARAAPLDDWIGALEPQHDQVLVVPEVGRVAGAARDAWSRLARHPAIDDRLDEIKDALARLVVQYPADLDAHVRAGLDLTGPALFVWSPGARTDILPFASSDAAQRWLRDIMETEPVPLDVLGKSGWQVGGAVAVYYDRALYIGAKIEHLAPFLGAPTAPPAKLSTCPRAPGQADLYFWTTTRAKWPESLRRGCLTVRVDPDRVRVDARVAVGEREALAGWFRDASGLFPQFGADATTTLVVGLGPKALARVRTAGAEKLGPLAAIMDGRFGFAMGPAISDFVAIAGHRDAEQIRQWVPTAQLEDAKITAESASRWRVDRPTPANWPKRVPKVETGWIDVTPAAVRIGTRESVIGDVRFVKARSRPDLSVLTGAAFAIQSRFAGRPHDGQVYADALAPLLRVLALDAAEVRAALGAVAWVGAHVAEVVFAGRVQDNALLLSLEWVLL